MIDPYLADPDVTLYNGDANDVLDDLPRGIARTCVTSPPFWGLRDYGHDDQIGHEESLEEYVDALVDVFAGVADVLSDDGTLWIEIGDMYSGVSGGDTRSGFNARWYGEHRNLGKQGDERGRSSHPRRGAKPKDLLGAPWRLAFALRDAGWYLRSEVIWHRPNPMPESIKDRPTKAHSTVFLFAKSPRYYYDAAALFEPYKHDGRRKTTVQGGAGSIQYRNGERWPAEGANARTVWSIAPDHNAFEHFAPMPEELARRMILAGADVGDVVLDPFAGSGTTGIVARKLQRQAILVELNAEYCALAADRLAQQSLFA